MDTSICGTQNHETQIQVGSKRFTSHRGKYTENHNIMDNSLTGLRGTIGHHRQLFSSSLRQVHCFSGLKEWLLWIERMPQVREPDLEKVWK